MRHLPIPEITSEIAARFWAKVNLLRKDECWLWAAGVFDDGYGSFWIGGGRKQGGKSYRSNRIAYMIHTGTDPGLKKVCHKCDTPLCCNPNHLWLGTSLENSKDMVVKGRNVAGESVANSILTESQVIEIRESIETNRTVAKRLGVDQSAVSLVRTRKAWKHIPESLREIAAKCARIKVAKVTRVRGASHHQAKLTTEQVIQIKASTESNTAIAAAYGVSRSTVSLIRLHKTWAHVT